MRSFILTSIAVVALAGGAMAQTAATTTPMKSATMTKKEAKAAAKAAAKSPTMVKPVSKPAPAVPMMAPKPAMAASPTTKTGAVGRKPMTAESKACSAQADVKGLHGKEREKFRRACLKG